MILSDILSPILVFMFKIILSYSIEIIIIKGQFSPIKETSGGYCILWGHSYCLQQFKFYTLLI